jgi:taurine dioxygenase
MTYQTVPLSTALGAEVKGVDLTHIDPSQAQSLNELWLEHHVLVIRDSPVTEDELVEFARSFGPIESARRMSPLASRPEIMVISNIREGDAALGALPDGELYWHFDRVHQKVPNKAGVLHSIELPLKGGETRFSNMCEAYDALSEETKRKLDGLTALNTYQYGQTKSTDKQLTEDSPSAVHPVVRTLPETGKKALYVCRLMTDRILELPEAESDELLNELFDHCERPEFTYEHSWKVGDTLIWDNRCVLHARNDFNENERRLLKRVTVGDTVAPAV